MAARSRGVKGALEEGVEEVVEVEEEGEEEVVGVVGEVTTLFTPPHSTLRRDTA